MKLPRTLLGGRIRTSTVGLMISFFAVLTVWILVRPEPVMITEEVSYDNGVVTVRKTTKMDGSKTTTLVEPTPTPSPKATPTPKPTPKPASGEATSAPVTPAPTPTGVGGLFAPPPTPTPTPGVPFEG